MNDRTNVIARFANGDKEKMRIYGPVKIGDRVQNASGAVAVVVEVLPELTDEFHTGQLSL